MDRGELEGLDRESLVVRAQAAGIRRARILTRPELIDELLRLDPNADEAQLRKSRGFFGRARDLVARVVERGLHLPDAADRIREIAGTGGLTLNVPRTEPQAMPTVTLAEIYAAQGHPQRAVETLRRVLEREPEHAAARALLARLEDDGYVAPPPPLPPEPENEPEPFPAEDDDDDDDGGAGDEAPRSGVVSDAHEGEAFGIRGPSYDDANGESEFSLAPASERAPADGTDQERTYTFIAPRSCDSHDTSSRRSLRADPDVDPTAPTGVFDVVGESASEAEVEASRAGSASSKVTAREPASTAAVAEEPEEIDECVAIPLPRAEGGNRMYVRWSVSFATIGRLLGAMPRGRFVVRAHVVTPGWDGPNAETRDLTAAPDDGEATLLALPDPSVTRVAVGWLDGATFVPLAHSPAIENGPRRGLVFWTPKGIVPVRLDEPRAAAIKRAWTEAQRVAQTRGAPSLGSV